MSLFNRRPKTVADAQAALAESEAVAAKATAAFEADPDEKLAIAQMVASEKLRAARRHLADLEKAAEQARVAALEAELTGLLEQVGADAFTVARNAEVERELAARRALQAEWLRLDDEARRRCDLCRRAEQLASELGKPLPQVGRDFTSWQTLSESVARNVHDRLIKGAPNSDNPLRYRRAVEWATPRSG